MINCPLKVKPFDEKQCEKLSFLARANQECTAFSANSRARIMCTRAVLKVVEDNSINLYDLTRAKATI